MIFRSHTLLKFGEQRHPRHLFLYQFNINSIFIATNVITLKIDLLGQPSLKQFNLRLAEVPSVWSAMRNTVVHVPLFCE